MKKVIPLIMASLLVLSVSVFAGVNEPVIKGTIGTMWEVVTSNVTEADASFKLSDENVCPDSGPYSLKMEHNNNVKGTIAIKIPVSLTVNSVYKITFKSTELMQAAVARQKVILGPSATGWAPGCKQFSSEVGVTTEQLGNGWRKHSFNYTAPTANLYLSLQTDMEGYDRYFDDFEISLLDENGNVSEILSIPNADFNFEDPAVTNIMVDKNVISWEAAMVYDNVNIYEKDADGFYKKLAELVYPENSYVTEVSDELRKYYLTTVTGGEESLEKEVVVVPDKQISDITLQNANQDILESLETGTLKAKISIENNFLEVGIRAQLIAVLYRDDAVILSKASEAVVIEQNGNLVSPTELSADLEIASLDDGEYRLEIFIWDSFETMNVVKNAVIINEPSNGQDI